MTVENSRNNPICPKCGAIMIERQKKGTTYRFWGCSRWSQTKCNGFLPFKVAKVERQEVMPVANVIGSIEQLAIWQEMVNGTAHLVVDAMPGSGKTFTIVHGANLMRVNKSQRILFLAFNKHIVTELESKLPKDVECRTIHSYAMNRVGKGKRLNVDADKLDSIVESFIGDEELKPLIGTIRRIVELCRYNLIDGTDEAELDMLCEHHSIDLNGSTSFVYTIVPQIIKAARKNIKTIDFTDMLEMYAALTTSSVEGEFDTVIVDELQDLNPLQKLVVQRAMGKSGRFIGVGDRNQSIYGFSGADVNSIPNTIDLFRDSSRGVKVLPITETRRCPQAVVALAQTIVPTIRAMDNASIGSVQPMQLEQALRAITVGSLGIARRNAPLISVAYKLIRAGIPVIVKGRDFGNGLMALVRKLRAKSLPELYTKAEIYRTKELEKLDAMGKKGESRKVSLNDRVDCIIAMCEGLDSVADLLVKIDQLFSDTQSSRVVTLSSVHKAKGLEAESVFIFDYKRIEINMSQDWAQVQEKNLHFVAVTRSKDRLVLVD